MSSDETALLRTILARPDDDAPRLVYAEWLEEHGQEERGEFIRVQCELCRLESDEIERALRTACDDAECGHEPCGLRRREAELLPVVRSHTPYIVPDPAIVLEDWEFHRGFIDGIHCDWPTWRDRAKPLRDFHPLLKYVILTTSPTWFYEKREGEIENGVPVAGPFGWVDTDDPVWPGSSHEQNVRVFQAKASYRWPGITFHLPEPPAPRTPNRFTNATGNNNLDDPANWSENRVPGFDENVTIDQLEPWMGDHFELVTGGLSTQAGPGSAMSLRMNPPVIRRRRTTPPQA